MKPGKHQMSKQRCQNLPKKKTKRHTRNKFVESINIPRLGWGLAWVSGQGIFSSNQVIKVEVAHTSHYSSYLIFGACWRNL